MVATNPSQPYITKMIPTDSSPDGRLTFRMTGFFAEVFGNLQVSKTALKKVMADLHISKINDHLTGFFSHYRES